MKIISASRRTDIPAYYSQWFLNQIEAGFVKWRNPFGGMEITTSLKPKDVAAIVFWSKNYDPLLHHLPALYDIGYRFVFQFTITGLPQVFEPDVPPADVTVPIARKLAEMYRPDAVLWRYDPILVSSITDIAYHRKRFAELANALEGSTHRCYFSFPTFYGKTIRNTEQLEQETGIRCIDPIIEEKIALASELAEIAELHGMEMFSCCCDVLISGKVKKAHCVDGELLAGLYPERMVPLRFKGTRQECGCFESTDIGTYDTCPHGCVYCYANTNKEVAERRWREFAISPRAASSISRQQ